MSTCWSGKKNEERLPLIIKGARQIGKTESINHFAEQNYSNIVSINFVLEPKYKTILSDGYAVEDIIKNISMIDTSKRFIAGDTVIIFDELQEFPDIATALKSFRIDGRFDVICSGFLLGINYRKIHSNSVGYKTDYEMFSMDFEEFLWAKDTRRSTLKISCNICRQELHFQKPNYQSIKNCFWNIVYLAVCLQ